MKQVYGKIFRRKYSIHNEILMLNVASLMLKMPEHSMSIKYSYTKYNKKRLN